MYLKKNNLCTQINKVKTFRKYSQKFRMLILIGWAFAIIWMYLGNLVNFHQHRIWGKQLIPVACTSNRGKDKESEFYVKSGIDFANFSDVTFPSFIISYAPLSAIDDLENSYITLLYFFNSSFKMATCLVSHSLRGPPQV